MRATIKTLLPVTFLIATIGAAGAATEPPRQSAPLPPQRPAEMPRAERVQVALNWDQVEGNWLQMKGRLRQQWGKLTEDDVQVMKGQREELVGKIQERYGITRAEADRQVETWLKSMK